MKFFQKKFFCEVSDPFELFIGRNLIYVSLKKWHFGTYGMSPIYVQAGAILVLIYKISRFPLSIFVSLLKGLHLYLKYLKYLPVRSIFPKFNPIVDGKGPNFDAWQRRASTLSFCLTKRSRVLFSNFVTLNLF